MESMGTERDDRAEAIDAHTQSDANATVEKQPSAPLTAASFPS